MLQELTPNDLLLLEKLRFRRLCSYFSYSLVRCSVYLDHHHTLIIRCFESWIVSALLKDMERLRQCVWIATGAPNLSIYYGPKEICRVTTHSTSLNLP